MAIYTLTGTDKEISVQGRYASVKNNGTETVYASSAPDLELNAAEVVPIQAGESVIVRDCRKKLYVRGSGQIAVVSGNEPVNFFKPAPKGNGGGSGDGITQQQLNDTLKSYATITSVDTKLEEYASKDEIPTSLPADGGNADTVGGKSAEELIQSNPNLLLNPDFKVNQRGKSEYGYDGSDRYTVDRWKLQANLTLTVHNDYVTVSRHDPTSNSHTGFRQELNIPDDTSVTLQACVKGNGSFTLFHNGFNGTAEIQVQDTDDWVVVKCTGYGASEVGVILRGTATSLDIKWIKLELGAVSTPFVPPNPLEEALKCGSLENAEQQIFYGDGVWTNAPSNPNLLDNPDFKINQRGQTEYRGLTYTVDRWKKTTAGIVTIDSDGVFLNNTNDTTAMYWGQTLLLDLASKTVSLSACDSNGNIYYLSGVAPKESKNPLKLLISDIGSFYVDLNVDHYEFFFQIKPGKSIKINWAKLELGSVATPFVPPNSATELVKCQRYFFKKGVSVPFKYGDFAADNSNGKYVAFVESFPVSMRTTPTVTVQAVKLNDTTGQMSKWIDGSTIVGSEVRANGTTSQGFSSILISKPGTATEGMACSIRYEASADL